MNLKYKVDQKQYIALLVEVLRTKETRLFQVLLFLALTLFQMAAILALCLLHVIPEGNRTSLIVLSAAMAAVNILYRALRPARASIAFRRMQREGTLHPDFWREHRLRIEAGKLLVSYGSLRLQCPCSEITELREIPGALCLFSGDKVFELVPADALAGKGGKSALLQSMDETDGPPDEERESFLRSLPSSPEYLFRFSYTRKRCLRMQVTGWRIIRITELYSRAYEVAKLFLSALLVYIMIQQTSVLLFLVCFGLILYANGKLLRILSPTVPVTLSQEIPFLNEREEVREAVFMAGDHAIFLYDPKHEFSLDYAEISRVVTMPAHTYIYGKGFPIFVVPARAMGSVRERIAFAEVLRRKK